jgi:NADH-quinone oxidoreductase subunit G
MLQQPRKAYLLWNTEVELDCHNPREALAAMHAADFVVACTPFRHRAIEYADVVLPIGPFTETAGSFVNTEGRLQSFVGVVRPFGESRPGWKVLRVLGGLLGLPAFGYDSAEEVRNKALGAGDLAARLSNLAPAVAPSAVPVEGLQRIAEVPIYFADALARRSLPLSKTRDALPPAARVNGLTLRQLGLTEGEQVRARQGGEAVLEVVEDASVPIDCVRIAAAHGLTADLGDMFGALTLEPLPQTQRVTA